MNNEPTLNKSLTDWERLDTLKDEEIDFSDCPEITAEMLKLAKVRRGSKITSQKHNVTPELDADVLP